MRQDAIIATGRSDYANQVNNVLGFPYIFRRASIVGDITQNMKMAATRALAALAKEPVPDYISTAYDGVVMQYGLDYIIPKPFDRRVLIWRPPPWRRPPWMRALWISAETFDINRYREELEARLGESYSVVATNDQSGQRGKRELFSRGGQRIGSPCGSSTCRATHLFRFCSGRLTASTGWWRNSG